MSNMPSASQLKLLMQQRLTAINNHKETAKAAKEAVVMQNSHNFVVPALAQSGMIIDTSREWNTEQLQAINAGLSGKSFCLIGAAGTGKTTTQKGIVYSLLKNNMLPMISAAQSTNYLKPNSHGIVICSFTNMAVRQSAKHFSKDITCVTIHKLLEFAPVYYDVEDADGNVTGTTMRFEPQRHAGNPLPASLKTILIDEASMVDTELFKLLWDALPNPHAVQFIFFGDLNQLPPVYGSPVLGRKLLELPVIELTQVYRQAMLSPIVSLAHKVKNGESVPVGADKQVMDGGEHGRVVIHPWSKKLGWEDALAKAQSHVRGALEAGIYDPFQDMILCPFNVNFGTVELNLAVSEYLGKQRNAVVHEIITGHDKKYLAVGDKVLTNKQEGFIVGITKNGKYFGQKYLDPNKFVIDRHGGASPRRESIEQEIGAIPDFDDEDFDVDEWLTNMSIDDLKGEERKRQSSHQVQVVLLNDHTKGLTLEQLCDSKYREDNELDTIVLTTSGELNEMIMGYAITVHKSQGSEWRNVFYYLHQSHSRMGHRELLYTGFTRAKEYLYVICEPDRIPNFGTITKAAKNPRLKGDTLAEKLVGLKELFDKQDAEEGKL